MQVIVVIESTVVNKNGVILVSSCHAIIFSSFISVVCPKKSTREVFYAQGMIYIYWQVGKYSSDISVRFSRNKVLRGFSNSMILIGK
jgi:hypothetical protein